MEKYLALGLTAYLLGVVAIRFYFKYWGFWHRQPFRKLIDPRLADVFLKK